MSTRAISWVYSRPVPRADNVTTFSCRLSWNLGASTFRNRQGLSRPLQGLLYLQFAVLWGVTVYFMNPFSSSLCRKTSFYLMFRHSDHYVRAWQIRQWLQLYWAVLFNALNLIYFMHDSFPKPNVVIAYNLFSICNAFRRCLVSVGKGSIYEVSA